MKDRLQNVAVAIGNVSILPVERDGVSGAGPVPEAQCASASWYGELLIKRAVSAYLRRPAAEAIGCVTRECGISPAVRKGVGDHGRVAVAVNNPARIEAASLEAAI